MRCKRCRAAMVEAKRSHHKKRKWVCPRCGRSRMQTAPKARDRRKG